MSMHALHAGFALLSCIGSMLRVIAARRRVPVLVTNHTTSAGSGGGRGNATAAGGDGEGVREDAGARDAWSIGGAGASWLLGHAK